MPYRAFPAFCIGLCNLHGIGIPKSRSIGVALFPLEGNSPWAAASFCLLHGALRAGRTGAAVADH